MCRRLICMTIPPATPIAVVIRQILPLLFPPDVSICAPSDSPPAEQLSFLASHAPNLQALVVHAGSPAELNLFRDIVVRRFAGFQVVVFCPDHLNSGQLPRTVLLDREFLEASNNVLFLPPWRVLELVSILVSPRPPHSVQQRFDSYARSSKRVASEPLDVCLHKLTRVIADIRSHPDEFPGRWRAWRTEFARDVCRALEAAAPRSSVQVQRITRILSELDHDSVCASWDHNAAHERLDGILERFTRLHVELSQ